MKKPIRPLRRAPSARAGLLALTVAAAPAVLCAQARVQDIADAQTLPAEQDSAVRTPETVVDAWPEGSRDVARVMIEKYGEPGRFSDDALVWRENGPWRRSVVYRSGWSHFFGGQDKGYLEQSIGYRVPEDKINALRVFDPRIRVDEISGELSARSESEPINYLALNLAEEIITEKRTVENARAVYRKVSQFYQAGRSSPYLSGFVFTSDNDRYASPVRISTHEDFDSPGNP